MQFYVNFFFEQLFYVNLYIIHISREEGMRLNMTRGGRPLVENGQNHIQARWFVLVLRDFSPPLIQLLCSIQKANTSKTIKGCVVVVSKKERQREMASFTASASTVSVARPALLLKPTVAVSAPVLGKVRSLVSSSILDLTLYQKLNLVTCKAKISWFALYIPCVVDLQQFGGEST